MKTAFYIIYFFLLMMIVWLIPGKADPEEMINL